MQLSIDKKQPGVLHIEAIKNKREEAFHLPVEYWFEFDVDQLPRTIRFPSEGDWEGEAIFFADVLLMTYLKGVPLPEQICFREARIPEIESLGRWSFF